MESAIGIIAFAALFLFCLAGLALIPIGLPGTFVIVAGALVYNLILWSMAVSLKILSALFVLALFGELLEHL